MINTRASLLAQLSAMRSPDRDRWERIVSGDVTCNLFRCTMCYDFPALVLVIDNVPGPAMGFGFNVAARNGPKAECLSITHGTGIYGNLGPISTDLDTTLVCE